MEVHFKTFLRISKNYTIVCILLYIYICYIYVYVYIYIHLFQFFVKKDAFR